MDFGGAELLVGAGEDGELGEEVGEGGCEGEFALPFEGFGGEERQIAVGGEGVGVAGVEGWDGHGAAPENKVLGEFADLGEGKGVGLGELEEAGMLVVFMKEW